MNEFLMSQYAKTETFNEAIELVCELPDWPMAGQFRSNQFAATVNEVKISTESSARTLING